MKKSITLIDLMVVIIVLGILTALAIPNIKNMKTKATFSSAFESKVNVQKGVDRYFLEKQTLPTQSQPTVGNPVLVDWTQLEPPYLIKRPQDIDKFYYWVDSFGTVWMADIDAPNNPSMSGTGTLTVSFDENPNASEYQVGYIDATAFRDTKNLNAANSYTWAKRGTKGDGNFTANAGKIQTTLPESDLSGKVLVVSAVSKNGLQTAPVGVGYRGTDLPTTPTTNPSLKNQKPIAVIEMSPNSLITTVTSIAWNYAGSTDPDGDNISDFEWQLDNNSVTKTPNGVVSAAGNHAMKLRVCDAKGTWSDWTSNTFTVAETAYSKMQLGQYVKFGNYNNKDLTWHVVRKDAIDGIMLVTTEPLMDSFGGYERRRFDPTHSNWERSEIRTWLNSDFYNATFTNKQVIADVSHNTLLSSTYSYEKTTGNATHIYDSNINSILQNYNTAYGKTVSDKIYLVGIKELYENVYPVLGNGYYFTLYEYWLRDPEASMNNVVRMVTKPTATGVSSRTASSSTTTYVRPALNIKVDVSVTGTGTQVDPYIIQ